MIRLKKLISKSEENKIISGLVQRLNVPVRLIYNDEIIFEQNIKKERDMKKKFPILAGDQVIGWLWGKEASYPVAELINYIISSEMEKKILAAETLERYRELVLLYAFSNKLGACLDINEVAKLALAEAMKYIPATAASLMLQNEINLQLSIAAEYAKGEFITNVINPEDGILRGVIDSGTSDIVNDVTCDSRYFAGNVKIGSMICAPIMVRSRIIGVIALGHTDKNKYTSENLKLFNAITFQTAIAIENAKLYGMLEETFFQTVKTLAETIEMRDPYTGGHTQRVMNYSLLIGNNMGLSKAEIGKLKLSALMHDIGKIGIGDSILLKTTRLSDEEYSKMRKHAEYGAEILKNIKQLKDIIPGVREHHERYDGTGYPDGLKGQQISLIGRIIAVADSFDAMTSERPYRKALGTKEAIEELRKNAGTQFDPKAVDAFIKIYEEKGDEIIEKYIGKSL